MKKKMGALALCAGLALMLSAQPAGAVGGLTIAQVKESAPDYWETGIVRGGEQVSAPVYVPDVEQMPVLRVRKGLFDDERLAAVFGDAAEENDYYRFYIRHYENPECIASGRDSNAYAQAVVEDMWQKTWRPTFARIFTDRRVWETGVVPNLENTYAEGQAISLGEVIDKMNAKLALLYGNNSILFMRATIRSGLYRYRGNGNYVDEIYPAGDYTGVGEYSVSGMQMLHGIPIFHPIRLAYQGLLATEETDLTRHAIWPQDIYFMYTDERNYFVGGCVIEETEMLAEDVPLCTAQEAINALSQLIEQGKIINVYNLKLGYVVGADPEITYPRGKGASWEEQIWRAVPMWICECSYVKDPNREYPDNRSDDPGASDPRDLDFHHSWLMVNAQTGEYLDTMRTDADRVYAPTLVTWDDIK